MGKTQFIKDFFEGQRISDVFLLTQKQMCVGKNQSNYLTLKLSDKTGEIDGKKRDYYGTGQRCDRQNGSYFSLAGYHESHS